MNLRTFGWILPLFFTSCGGATASGVALGKVGEGLSDHARGVPQGAGVCQLREALAAQPGVEKPTSETCNRIAKNDALWRRSIVVLAAHAQTLEAIASGADSATAGQLEAARTGVSGPNWIEVEDAQEKAARDAVTQLVNQMSTASAKGDLDKAIKDAAPHVKTLCDGLGPYLDAQAKAFGEIQTEIEKKRIARTDRRCTTIDSKPVCVSDSATDRVVYAATLASLSELQASHGEARDAVNAFCAAYTKLGDASAKGKTSDDATYTEIIEAVKASRGAQTAAPAAPSASPSASPSAAPSAEPKK